MAFRLRKEKKNLVEDSHLVLPDSDGAPAQIFPVELIESMRKLLSRLSREDSFPSSLAVVGALRQEGVTTISRALAATLAYDLAARVCLVELNWWWPSSPFLSSSNDEGLNGLLGHSPLQEVLIYSGWPNLAYLPAGQVRRLDRPVVARSDSLKVSIAALGRQFDHLVLDIPAILATNDGAVLAGLAQSTCLVIRQGATHTNDVRRALDEIEHLNIAGVALNKIVQKTPKLLTDFFPAV